MFRPAPDGADVLEVPGLVGDELHLGSVTGLYDTVVDTRRWDRKEEVEEEEIRQDDQELKTPGLCQRLARRKLLEQIRSLLQL